MHGSRLAKKPECLQAMLTGRSRFPEIILSGANKHPPSQRTQHERAVSSLSLTVVDPEWPWLRLQPGLGTSKGGLKMPPADMTPLQDCIRLMEF